MTQFEITQALELLKRNNELLSKIVTILSAKRVGIITKVQLKIKRKLQKYKRDKAMNRLIKDGAACKEHRTKFEIAQDYQFYCGQCNYAYRQIGMPAPHPHIPFKCPEHKLDLTYDYGTTEDHIGRCPHKDCSYVHTLFNNTPHMTFIKKITSR